jgi:hypothetical protein
MLSVWQLSLTCAALRRFRQSDDADAVKFTVVYKPFQLYPGASIEGEDKYECRLNSLPGALQAFMSVSSTSVNASYVPRV